MQFVVTWMDLEIIILNNVRNRKTYDINYMWNLKYDTNGHIYETKPDLQIEEICGCQAGKCSRKVRTRSLGLLDANCYIQDI